MFISLSITSIFAPTEIALKRDISGLFIVLSIEIFGKNCKVNDRGMGMTEFSEENL